MVGTGVVISTGPTPPDGQLAVLDIDRGNHRAARAALEALLPRFTAHSAGLVGMGVRLAIAECCAALGDWSAFDAHVAHAEQRIAETRHAAAELMEFANRAADAAETNGQPDRAARARVIADGQKALLS